MRRTEFLPVRRRKNNTEDVKCTAVFFLKVKDESYVLYIYIYVCMYLCMDGWMDGCMDALYVWYAYVYVYVYVMLCYAMYVL